MGIPSCDDGFDVVIPLLLEGASQFVDGLPRLGIELHLGYDLLVVLKDLHRIPSSPGCADCEKVGYPGHRGLDIIAEDILWKRDLSAVRHLHGLVDQLAQSGLLQRRGLDDRTAENHRQPLRVDLQAPLSDQVGHVERDDHGDSGLDELRRQVEVPLDVRGIHQIDDDIRVLIEQIVAGDDLLQSIGTERIDSGKVRDDDLFTTLPVLQPSLLLLDRDARPVADILVGTCERVEHGRLSAVGVSCKCDSDSHLLYTSLTSTHAASPFLTDSS